MDFNGRWLEFSCCGCSESSSSNSEKGNHSSQPSGIKISGLVITRIALGNSGHKSRTSKTKNFLRNNRAQIPGIAAVSGVEVAKSTSYFSVIAIQMLRNANFRNTKLRLKKPCLLSYGSCNSRTSIPSTAPRRIPDRNSPASPV